MPSTPRAEKAELFGYLRKSNSCNGWSNPLRLFGLLHPWRAFYQIRRHLMIPIQLIIMVVGLVLVFAAWIGFRKPDVGLPSFPFGRFPKPWASNSHLSSLGISLYAAGCGLFVLGVLWNIFSLLG